MPPIPRDENYQRLLRGEMTAAEYVAGVRTKIRLEHARFSDRLRARIAELERENERLQVAVDRAHGAMIAGQYVGGLSEQETYRTVVEALGAVATQHQGMNPAPGRGDGQDAD